MKTRNLLRLDRGLPHPGVCLWRTLSRVEHSTWTRRQLSWPR